MIQIKSKRELKKPPISKLKSALEVLRVWVIPGEREEFHFQTRGEDVVFWGILFASIAKQVCKVRMKTNPNENETELKDRIFEGFEYGWNLEDSWSIITKEARHG